MADNGDPWGLLDRFPRMSSIGRAIMGKKLDRALAAVVAHQQERKGGAVYQHFAAKVDELTRDINRLACTAAKNW